MNQEEKSRIDEIRGSLYSRNSPDIRTKRKSRLFSPNEPVDINTDWEHPKEIYEQIELNKRYKDSSMSFFTKLFIFSIIIFILALGAGAYLLFKGSNIVSANNIEISINGPVSVAGGEPVSFDVQVTNKNNIKLETVDLAIDFPAGTVDVDDTTKELKSIRELIPDIEPGSQGTKNIKAIVYGEENSKKEIKVTVEYRVKGSSAVFQKQKIFDLLVSSSPLNLSVSSFTEVNSGQEFEFTLTMNSNSKETIKNLLISASYPFGFSFTSSSIKPLADNNVWKIGDIPPGGKKTLKIKGKLDGQDDEMRVFRFNTGAQSVKNDKQIGTEYVSAIQEISIKKPFISVGVSMDGESELQEYVGKFDTPIQVEITYFNNLDTAIINGEVHAKLSGNAFDKVSVVPGQGLYVSANNEIVWNPITTSDLRNIGAGESGRVSFSIIPRNNGTQTKPLSNPEINLSVSVQGKRNSENNVPESIVSSANRKIKVSSDIALSGQVVRSTGPFENIGPIPPKAEQTTTYTVVWTVDNTSNAVSGAEVRSSLPSYVRWVGSINPSDEDISYNKVDGQVVWRLGGLNNTSSRESRRRQVSFQVSLTPSITQVNQIPIIVNDATLTAQDDFTNQPLNSSLTALSTRFSTDPAFREGDEIIGN
jgi:hypothetical protein